MSKDKFATERQMAAGNKLGLDLTDATRRTASLVIANERRKKILSDKGLSVGSKVSYKYHERTGIIERGVPGLNVRVRWDNNSVTYVSPKSLAPL